MLDYRFIDCEGKREAEQGHDNYERIFSESVRNLLTYRYL
jgi:hypothetical protein